MLEEEIPGEYPSVFQIIAPELRKIGSVLW